MALSTTSYGYVFDPFIPFLNDAGQPINGGYIKVLSSSTSAYVETYCNWDGAANPENIPLDNAGRCQNVVIGRKDGLYKIMLCDETHGYSNPVKVIDKILPSGSNFTIEGDYYEGLADASSSSDYVTATVVGHEIVLGDKSSTEGDAGDFISNDDGYVLVKFVASDGTKTLKRLKLSLFASKAGSQINVPSVSPNNTGYTAMLGYANAKTLVAISEPNGGLDLYYVYIPPMGGDLQVKNLDAFHRKAWKVSTNGTWTQFTDNTYSKAPVSLENRSTPSIDDYIGYYENGRSVIYDGVEYTPQKKQVLGIYSVDGITHQIVRIEFGAMVGCVYKYFNVDNDNTAHTKTVSDVVSVDLSHVEDSTGNTASSVDEDGVETYYLHKDLQTSGLIDLGTIASSFGSTAITGLLFKMDSDLLNCAIQFKVSDDSELVNVQVARKNSTSGEYENLYYAKDSVPETYEAGKVYQVSVLGDGVVFGTFEDLTATTDTLDNTDTDNVTDDTDGTETEGGAV